MADFDAALTFRVNTEQAYRDIKAGREKAAKEMEKGIEIPVQLRGGGIRELVKELKYARQQIKAVETSAKTTDKALGDISKQAGKLSRNLNKMVPGAAGKIKKAFQAGGGEGAQSAFDNLIETMKVSVGHGDSAEVKRGQQQAEQILNLLERALDARQVQEKNVATKMTAEQKKIAELLAREQDLRDKRNELRERMRSGEIAIDTGVGPEGTKRASKSTRTVEQLKSLDKQLGSVDNALRKLRDTVGRSAFEEAEQVFKNAVQNVREAEEATVLLDEGLDQFEETIRRLQQMSTKVDDRETAERLQNLARSLRSIANVAKSIKGGDEPVQEARASLKALRAAVEGLTKEAGTVISNEALQSFRTLGLQLIRLLNEQERLEKLAKSKTGRKTQLEARAADITKSINEVSRQINAQLGKEGGGEVAADLNIEGVTVRGVKLDEAALRQALQAIGDEGMVVHANTDILTQEITLAIQAAMGEASGDPNLRRFGRKAKRALEAPLILSNREGKSGTRTIRHSKTNLEMTELLNKYNTLSSRGRRDLGIKRIYGENFSGVPTDTLAFLLRALPINPARGHQLPQPYRGPKAAPLPLPQLVGFDKNDPIMKELYKAWNTVSARYPRLAATIPRIEAMPGADFQGRFQTATGAIGLNTKDVFTQGHIEEVLFHELVHAAQKARGQIEPLTGGYTDYHIGQNLSEAYAYRMSLAAETARGGERSRIYHEVLKPFPNVEREIRRLPAIDPLQLSKEELIAGIMRARGYTPKATDPRSETRPDNREEELRTKALRDLGRVGARQNPVEFLKKYVSEFDAAIPEIAKSLRNALGKGTKEGMEEAMDAWNELSRRIAEFRLSDAPKAQKEMLDAFFTEYTAMHGTGLKSAFVKANSEAMKEQAKQVVDEQTFKRQYKEIEAGILAFRGLNAPFRGLLNPWQAFTKSYNSLINRDEDYQKSMLAWIGARDVAEGQSAQKRVKNARKELEIAQALFRQHAARGEYVMAPEVAFGLYGTGPDEGVKYGAKQLVRKHAPEAARDAMETFRRKLETPFTSFAGRVQEKIDDRLRDSRRITPDLRDYRYTEYVRGIAHELSTPIGQQRDARGRYMALSANQPEIPSKIPAEIRGIMTEEYLQHYSKVHGISMKTLRTEEMRKKILEQEIRPLLDQARALEKVDEFTAKALKNQRLVQAQDFLREHRQREPLGYVRAIRGASYIVGGYALGMTAGFQLRRAAGDYARLQQEQAITRGVIPSHGFGEAAIIRSGVNKAAKEYGGDLLQTAQAARLLAQSGLSANEVVTELNNTMLGMKGLQLTIDQTRELQLAIRAISRTNEQLIEGIDNTGAVFEKVARIEAQYAITAQNIADAIKVASPVMNQFAGNINGIGDAYDYTIGLSTVMVETLRVTGKQAGDALKFIFARLARPEVGRRLQEQFGVRLGVTGEEYLALPDLLRELKRVYDQLSDAQKKQFAVLLGGGRRLNFMLAQLDNLDRVLQVADESSRSFGEAQLRTAINLDTVQTAMAKVNTSFRLFLNNFLEGTSVAKGFERIIKAVAAIMSGFTGEGAGLGTAIGSTIAIGGGWRGLRGVTRWLGDVKDARLLRRGGLVDATAGSIRAARQWRLDQQLGSLVADYATSSVGVAAGTAAAQGGFFNRLFGRRSAGLIARAKGPAVDPRTGIRIGGATTATSTVLRGGALRGILAGVTSILGAPAILAVATLLITGLLGKFGRPSERDKYGLKPFDATARGVRQTPQFARFRAFAKDLGFKDVETAYTKVNEIINDVGSAVYDVQERASKGLIPDQAYRETLSDALISDLGEAGDKLKEIESDTERWAKSMQLLQHTIFFTLSGIQTLREDFEKVIESLNTANLDIIRRANTENTRTNLWQRVGGWFSDVFTGTQNFNRPLADPKSFEGFVNFTAEEGRRGDIRKVFPEMGKYMFNGFYDALKASGFDEYFVKNFEKGTSFGEYFAAFIETPEYFRPNVYAERVLPEGEFLFDRLVSGWGREDLRFAQPNIPITGREALVAGVADAMLETTGITSPEALNRILESGDIFGALPDQSAEKKTERELTNVFTDAYQKLIDTNQVFLGYNAEQGRADALKKQIDERIRAEAVLFAASEETAQAFRRFKDMILEALISIQQSVAQFNLELKLATEAGFAFDEPQQRLGLVTNVYKTLSMLDEQVGAQILRFESERQFLQGRLSRYLVEANREANLIAQRQASEGTEGGAGDQETPAQQRYTSAQERIRQLTSLLDVFQGRWEGLKEGLLQLQVAIPRNSEVGRDLANLLDTLTPNFTREDIGKLMPRILDIVREAQVAIVQRQIQLQDAELLKTAETRLANIAQKRGDLLFTPSDQLANERDAQRAILVAELGQLAVRRRLKDISYENAEIERSRLIRTQALNEYLEAIEKKEEAILALQRQSFENIKSGVSGFSDFLKDLSIYEEKLSGIEVVGKAVGKLFESIGTTFQSRIVDNFSTLLSEALYENETIRNLFGTPELKMKGAIKDASETYSKLFGNEIVSGSQTGAAYFSAAIDEAGQRLLAALGIQRTNAPLTDVTYGGTATGMIGTTPFATGRSITPRVIGSVGGIPIVDQYPTPQTSQTLRGGYTYDLGIRQSVQTIADANAAQGGDAQWGDVLTSLGISLAPHLSTPTALAINRGGSASGAATGGQVGSMVGAALGAVTPLGPVVGSMLGSLGGSLIGSLFGGDDEPPPTVRMLDAIERAQRDTITAIEQQTDALLAPENRLINLPSTFAVPSYNPTGRAGAPITVNVTVNGDVGFDSVRFENTVKSAVGNALDEAFSRESRNYRRY